MTTLVTTLSLIVALGLAVTAETQTVKGSSNTEICGGPEGLLPPPPVN